MFFESVAYFPNHNYTGHSTKNVQTTSLVLSYRLFKVKGNTKPKHYCKEVKETT